MAITKKYSRNKEVCKVTFTIPKEVASNFQKIALVGEFNNWDPDAIHFTEREKDGSFSVSIELPTGREYAFRYLADGVTWMNEPEADKFTPTGYGDSENSVIIL